MKRLLLDTHVLVWAEEGLEEIGESTRQLLLAPKNRLFLSPVSTLELARLQALHRLTFKNHLATWLEVARKHLQISDAPFTHEIAMESYALPGEFHRDPADRMLVATARLHSLSLVTADARILSYPHVSTIDART
jgi:PIN domain nuclease of toxin-antitoxin system